MDQTTEIARTTDEATPDAAPSRGNRTGAIVAVGLFVLCSTGYFIYSGGAEGFIGSSPLAKKILVMIGMGPKAGVTRFIAPATGTAIIAAIALSLLSGGGRDVQTEKERAAKHKKKPQKPGDSGVPAPAAKPEEEECNLASYQMFKSLLEAEEPAESKTTTTGS